mmetsp:Transcript_30768/g.50813  ORF Transcript_30768/g.50813 Transcript_30768/m.50813 type:complete len:224 (+) Transcript_30768:1673-2344(+)
MRREVSHGQVADFSFGCFSLASSILERTSRGVCTVKDVWPTRLNVHVFLRDLTGCINLASSLTLGDAFWCAEVVSDNLLRAVANVAMSFRQLKDALLFLFFDINELERGVVLAHPREAPLENDLDSLVIKATLRSTHATRKLSEAEQKGFQPVRCIRTNGRLLIIWKLCILHKLQECHGHLDLNFAFRTAGNLDESWAHLLCEYLSCVSNLLGCFSLVASEYP